MLLQICGNLFEFHKLPRKPTKGLPSHGLGAPVQLKGCRAKMPSLCCSRVLLLAAERFLTAVAASVTPFHPCRRVSICLRKPSTRRCCDGCGAQAGASSLMADRPADAALSNDARLLR